MSAVREAQDGLLVGVDAGGTKVAVLVADGAGAALSRITVPTLLADPAATLGGIAAAVREAVAAAGRPMTEVAAVGLGVPGQVEPATGRVRHAVNLGWVDVAAGAELGAALGVPCLVENDVRLAALGLYHFPEFTALRSLAYVSVGTGIAAGLILDGRLYRGSHGMAGEIGHMIVAPGGPRCPCGTRGCLEAVAGGRAIAHQARQAVARGAATLLATGRDPTAATVYAAAAGGDAAAGALVATVAAYLAQAVQQLVMAYDVEAVIFGGGVSRAGEAFMRPLLAEIERLREESALMREMLRPGLVQRLSPGYEVGPWGGVLLAGARHDNLKE
jgi:glucokinase